MTSLSGAHSSSLQSESSVEAALILNRIRLCFCLNFESFWYVQKLNLPLEVEAMVQLFADKAAQAIISFLLVIFGFFRVRIFVAQQKISNVLRWRSRTTCRIFCFFDWLCLSLENPFLLRMLWFLWFDLNARWVGYVSYISLFLKVLNDNYIPLCHFVTSKMEY